MNIIPIHNTPSKRVERWGDVAKDAQELKKLVVVPQHGLKAIALHHSQVSAEPFNFFVVHPEIVAAGIFNFEVVLNPEIVPADDNIEADRRQMVEGCMSFSLRKPKKMLRSTRVAVNFETRGPWGLRKHHEIVPGIVAQMFQHETDHAKGRNIYQN